MPPNILSKASDADASVTLAGGSADLRPLTGAQQNIWFHQQIDLQSAAYHLSYYCSLNGELDAARLAAAVNYAIATIEPLRAQFVVKEGKPYQRTQSHIATRLQVVDLSHSVDPDRLAHDEMRELQAKQLHLESGEVCRFALFKLAPRRWIWQWVVHHICLDGVGAEVLIQTVSKAYRDNLTSEDGAFRASSPDAISWSQAIEEDYAYSQSDQWAKDRAYWDRKLQDLDSPASMSDQEIDELYIGQPHRVFAELPRAEFMALLECGRAVCGSAYTLFSSAALIYLAKLCGKEDLTISVPTSGRQKNSRGVPGTLANQVPLRVKVAFDQTVTDLMISAANELKEGLAHNRMPFREIHLMRRQQGLPIASSVNINLVSFNYLADFGSVKGSFRMIGTAAVADVSLNIWDQRDDGPVQFAFEYNPERYSSLQASDHLDNLLSLFCTLPLNLQTKVGQLALLSPIKRDELIRASRGLVDPQVSCSLSELFEMGANTHASRVAVIHASEEIAYGELHSKSALVSDRLNELGVGPGDTVAMMLEPSIPMIAVMLGIIKSGAAYLPIDLSYPKDRIDYILKDSAASVVLSHAGAIGRLDLMSMPGFEDSGGIDLGSLLIQVIRTHLNREPRSNHESKLKLADRQATYAQHVEQLAYVIYTSGSTGMPKGVAVVNRGVVNMVLGQILSFDIKPGDRVFQFASLAFDASVSEVFTALCAGATLVLPPTVDRNELSARLPEVCREFAITHITVPPVLLSIFDSNSFPTVETLIVAGEACAPAVVSKFAGQHRMLNAYGPTEASVCASISDPLDALMDGPQAKAPVPIGHPIWNTQLYILDACLEPMPEGVVGELYIAGDGLARGYLGRPGLTAERFIANPFGFGSSRMYRTGDVGRRREDGAIEYLGRADDQVKLRGFRIELGEIESALRTQFHELSQVAVIVRKVHEEMRLVAYVVGHAQGELPEVSQMRQQLARVLPEYMVPGHFVELKQLPLTANGKLDRKALPEPVGQVSETSYRAARSSSERLLCEIFSELTGVSQVGIDDNFFAIGGDSISAIRLVSRARAAGLGFTVRDVFQHQTPEALAALAQPIALETAPSVWEENGEIVALPIYRAFLQAGGPLDYFNQAMCLVAPESMTHERAQAAINRLCHHHAALRLRTEQRGHETHFLVDPVTAFPSLVLDTLDVSMHDASQAQALISEAFSSLASRLTPSQSGGMIAPLWVERDAQPALLCLVIHHFAIDGVSWRVLLDDLNALSLDDRAVLAPNTMSLKAWSLLLQEQGLSGARRVEDKMWRKQLHGACALPQDHLIQTEDNIVGHVAQVRGTLNASVTQRLLRAPAVYYGQVNDLLLAALGLAIRGWGLDRYSLDLGDPLVAMEGHGRETQADLTRTIGWMTSLFPLRLPVGELELDDASSLGYALRRVKEQLRAFPDKGLGYGILRYLDPESELLDADLPEPQVLFNYLGRFERAAVQSAHAWQAGSQAIVISDDRPERVRAHLLEFNAVLDAQDALVIELAYCSKAYSVDSMNDLVARFVSMLQLITAHCHEQPLTNRHTPSDFPLVTIDQSTLDDLFQVCPDTQDIVPLTPLQQGLAFESLALAAGAYDPYHVQLTITLKGRVDVAAMQRAWSMFVDRHAILRMVLAPTTLMTGVAIIRANPLHAWSVVEFGGSPQSRLEQLRLHDRAEPFSLEQGPLIRARLMDSGDGHSVLMIANHHMLLDGWSMPIMIAELGRLYEAQCRAISADLGRSFVWQHHLEWLRNQDKTSAQHYWQGHLQGLSGPSRLELSAPAVVGSGMGELLLALSTETSVKLEQFARRQGLTQSSVVQGLYALMLARASRLDEIVIGTVRAGRGSQLPGIESGLGLFIDTLPLRLSVTHAQTLGQWLHAQQIEQATQEPHAHLGLMAIQSLVGLSGVSLFEAMFVFENYPFDSSESRFGDLRIKGLQGQDGAHYPLVLAAIPGASLQLRLNYDRARFDEPQARSLLARLAHMLDVASEHADTPLIGLPWLTTAERTELIESSRGAAHAGPASTTTMLSLYEQQVPLRGDAVALIWGEGESRSQMSYSQLDARANQLARYLIAQGIGADQIVAILLDRSPQMIVAMLAILKAGAAYLPMDPNHPIDRLQFMLSDSKAKFLFTTNQLHDRLTNDPDASNTLSLSAEVLRIPSIKLDDASVFKALIEYSNAPVLENERKYPVNPHHLAYLIYTSGSTGQPKATGITQQNVTRLFEQTNNWFQFNANDVWTLFHSIAFDFSVWEIWGALFYGGRLVIVSDEVRRSTPEFLRLLSAEQVTVLNQTPSAFDILISADAEDVTASSGLSLRYVIFGGESLNTAKLAVWWNKHPVDRPKLINMYGITETTVHVTYRPLEVEDSQLDCSPIGGPIPDLASYILDETLEPVPVGVVGEIYVEGAGLARGYLGRPSLTAQRFIANPFGLPGSRLYRSGDLACRLSTGEVAHLGRADHQVKIRGYRIELGEIEAALLSEFSEVISQVAVLNVPRNGQARLVAYVVGHAQGELPEVSQMRQQLARVLPEYMVPGHFVELKQLPLTANGKLDRKALPEPVGRVSETSYRAARSSSERLLCEIFSELTGVSQVGIDDNFFAIGGHSLLAMRLVARVRQRSAGALALRTLFECPTPAQLAPFVDAIQKDMEPDLLPGLGHLNDERVVLSYGQRRLWTLDRLEGASATYNMPMAMRIRGALDANALEQALSLLIERHEPLRTVMIEGEDGVPYGLLLPIPELSKVLVREEFDQSESLRARIERESALPFNLGQDLSIRATLINCGIDDAVLMLTIHHQAGDGISLGVLMDELSQAYSALVQGNEPGWKELAVQYSDWAAWQQSVLTKTLAQKVECAKERLSGMPESLSLPLDYPRQANRTRKAGYVSIELPVEVTRRLELIAREKKTTLFTVVLASYGALLARLSGQSEIVIGSPVSGRNRVECERLVGFMVNTLALPLTMDRTSSLIDLVDVARTSVEQALIDQDLPFEKLVEELNVPRSLAHTPVFQTMLTYQDDEQSKFTFVDAQAEDVSALPRNAKFDLTLHVKADNAGGLNGLFEFDASLFNEATVKSWALVYANLIASVSQNSDSPILIQNWLSVEQRTELIESSRGAAHAGPASTTTMLSLYEQQVPLRGDAVALIWGEGESRSQMSYSQLDARANQLARYLIAQGIGADQIVAILLDRSPQMIVAMLAILKAGAAYLPMDPEYPKDRLQFMLSDSSAKLLLTDAQHFQSLQSQDGGAAQLEISTPTLHLDAVSTVDLIDGYSELALQVSELRQPLREENLAYLIYTSGSTGRPKGAGNTHAALVNRLLWMQDVMRLTHSDRVLQKTAIGFDVAVWEWFLPLMTGAGLVIAKPGGQKDPEYLRDLIDRHQVSAMHFVPSMLSVFVEDIGAAVGCCSSLRQIVTSGEALNGVLQADTLRCLPGVTLLNLYGPTEAAIDVSVWRCRPEDGILTPPIGHPIWNTQLYILDACLEPMPEGVVGELYIAGDGLARGYLGRPGLTAERFIANPFGFGSSRMYRTGDVGRRRADGAIEYLGRADDQVKLRGFRIELGEIESALRTQFHELSQVAVIVRKVHEEMRLVAYVVGHAQGELPEVSQMRQQLARVLPEYMVPGHFVELKQLPLTANGKLDRKALPEPVGQVSETSYRAARSSSERLLCEIFSELTGVSQVSIDDNFFAIGGHSLLAMRLVARVRQRSAGALALRTVLECPTPAQLAPFVDAIQKDMEPDLLPGLGHLNDERVVLSYGQRRLWTLDRLEGASATYNMPMAMRIRGALDANALEQALSLLIERHEPLRTVMIEGEDGVPYGLLLPIPELSKVLVREEFDQSESLRARIERESALPFNLGQDLSIRATLINCGIDDAVLMLTIHHQAGDGISLGVLMDELSQAYSALVQGNEPGWKELAVQYSDWAAWQQSVLTKTLAQKVERAKERLSGMPESLSLPLDYPRQANRTRKAGYVSIELPVEVTRRLELIAREKKTTLFTVVLASYGALLARLSGQSEIVIGSPVSGRNRVECERLVGFMVNTLALPLTMDRTSSLIDLVDVARTSVEQALIDQDLPFEKLVEELNVPRSLAHTPVFQTMLAFQTEQSSHANLLGLSCSPEHVELPSAKFDLMLFLHVANGKLTGAMEYDADLFSQERVEVWARAYEFLTKELIENPDLPLMSRPLLDQQAVVSSTANYVSADKCLGDLTLHSLFEEQVAGVPDNLALVFEDQRLTYSELNKRANQLGRKLLQMGVAPGSLVAVSLPRSIDMIVSVLAILKTGAGYVPLDPEYPINRLHYMIGDSAAVVMISTTSVIARLDKAAEEIDSIMQWPELLCLDRENVVTDIASLDDGVIDDSERLGLESPDNLAYVIYTSGSTGIPKGIEMRSGALVNLLVWQRQSAAAPRNYGAVLQFTSISFDVSFQEIFAALSVGDALVLLPAEDRLNAQAVLNTIERHGVTELYAPQSVIQFLVSEALRARPSSLKHIYQAGEALKLTDEIKEFLSLNPSVTLHNHYGPAETHVVTSWFASRDALAQELEPSIGNPIDGGEIYILDSALATVPKGVIGELYIAGECLARGYLNKPGMTAERFVANPFGKSGQRMYRSGDLASWNFDGSIAYHGRADQQVKIRGFRIELGEIEATLAREFAFQQVVVVPWGQSSDLKLVAYVVTELNASLPKAGVIRTALSKKLPDYMVPSAYVQIDRIPVTQNGKLNRSALPEPKFEGAFDLYRAPGSENEKLICKLFEELTQSTRVGLDDSFFDLGGHSLLAMRLITRIRVDTGLEISLRTLFENPIAEHLAQQLAQAKKSSKPKLVRGMGKKV